MTSDAFAIGHDERLDRIERERKSRQWRVYLVADKFRNHIMLSQKLEPIADYINTNIAEDAADLVSLQGLYHSSGKANKQYKFRSNISQLNIHRAPEVYESSRVGFQNALIFGQPECYKIQAA